MKCAHCHHTPQHICDKEGFDCTGGTLDLPEYQEKENQIMHRTSMIMLHEYGNSLTRLEELIEFCKRLQFQRLGIAFCVGLSQEAESLSKVLEQQQFKVCLLYTSRCV